MKKLTLLMISCILALVTNVSQAAEVWIRPDGPNNTGDGSAGNPYVRTNAASFDALMPTIPENSTIHLMAGTFHTETTILMKNGWKVRGAGMNSTKVVFDNHTGINPFANSYTWFSVFQGRRVLPTEFPNDANQEVADLTIDCNLAGQSSNMVVHAAILVGDYSAIRRVRAINWGSNYTPPPPGLPWENFVLAISCWGSGTTNRHNVIEDCIVEQPAAVTFSGMVSAFTISGGDPNSTTPGAGWTTDGEIRSCYVGNITAGTGGVGSPAGIQAFTFAGGIRGMRVVNNVAVNLVGGVGVYNDTGSVIDTVVENNLLLNVNNGIVLGTSITNQVYENLTIRDNLITLNSQGGDGIILNASSSIPSSKVTVSGNNVWTHNSGDTATALKMWNVNNAFIDDNVFDTSPNPTGSYDIHVDSTVKVSSFQGNRDLQGHVPLRFDGSAEQLDDQVIKFRPTQGEGWYRLLSAVSAGGGSVKLFTSPWSWPHTDVEFQFTAFAYTAPANLDHVGDIHLMRYQKYGTSDLGGIISKVRVGADNSYGFLDVYVSDDLLDPGQGQVLSNYEITLAAKCEKPFHKAPSFLGNPGTAPDPNKTLVLGPGIRTTGPIFGGYPQTQITDLLGKILPGALPNLSIASFNSGTGASANTFWRGDGTWVPIANTVRKLTDQSKSSDTTLADDSTLKFTMAANTKYTIRLKVFFTTGATPDFKYRIAGPAATLIRRHITRAVGGEAPTTFALSTTYSPADIVMDGTGADGFIQEEIIVHNGGTAGDFVFRWAQNTSSATATKVLAGSYIEYMPF